jgi:hypothetical protein
MTNTELKNQIDTALNNSVPDNSINPASVATQIKSVVDYVDQEISNIELTPGPAGPQGIQGPTGPQGATGPSGTAPVGTQGLVTASTSFPHPVLTNSLNQVLATADNNSRVVLPTSTAVVGQKVVVSCIGDYKLLVKASQVGGGIYINGVNNDLVNEFYIYPNETYEFTYNDNAEWVSYFEAPKVKYKSYVAQIIPESSSVITTNVLENTLGTTVTVSWVSGKINIVLGSELITLTNPYLSTSNYFQDGIYHLVTPSLLGFDSIELASYKVSGTPSAEWSYGARINFELRIYN